jgi:hypothetical protein
MKSHRALLLASAVAASGLAGCATPAVYNPVIPYDQSAQISGFAIAGDAVPEKAVGLDAPMDYSALNNAMNAQMYSNPAISPGAAAAGGLIAGLIIAGIDAAVDSARNGRINGFLSAQGFDARAVFYEALRAELSKNGYTLAVVEPGAAPPAGAPRLTVAISHYGWAITGQGWAPTVSAAVQVTSADGRVLLSDTVALGAPPMFVAQAAVYDPLGGNVVILPYDPAYVVKDVDAIVQGDPARSIAGLRFALGSTAAGVARLVRTSAPTTTVQPAAAVASEVAPPAPAPSPEPVAVSALAPAAEPVAVSTPAAPPAPPGSLATAAQTPASH